MACEDGSNPSTRQEPTIGIAHPRFSSTPASRIQWFSTLYHAVPLSSLAHGRRIAAGPGIVALTQGQLQEHILAQAAHLKDSSWKTALSVGSTSRSGSLSDCTSVKYVLSNFSHSGVHDEPPGSAIHKCLLT